MEGKVVLITGGSDGIGRATGELFAARGARVVLAARGAERGEAVAAQIRARGGDAIFVRADVSREPDVAALVARCVALHGRLDCAFNNAGGEPNGRSRFHEQTLEGWTSVMDVHLGGIFLALKHELPALLAAGGGAVVNMSSIYGLGADTVTYPSYVASKHGTIGLTRIAALQYATKNIRVNAVCPGVVRTPMLARALAQNSEIEERFVAMHPMRRLAEPSEVAEAVWWLCSDAASFVTGIALPVDGGVTASL
jgi:NAD(P)-dependent dehydrogenase (short-subunit alcohol dehydrogenase family)